MNIKYNRVTGTWDKVGTEHLRATASRPAHYGVDVAPTSALFLIDSGPPETVREAISAFPAPPETYSAP